MLTKETQHYYSKAQNLRHAEEARKAFTCLFIKRRLSLGVLQKKWFYCETTCKIFALLQGLRF